MIGGLVCHTWTYSDRVEHGTGSCTERADPYPCICECHTSVVATSPPPDVATAHTSEGDRVTNITGDQAAPAGDENGEVSEPAGAVAERARLVNADALIARLHSDARAWEAVPGEGGRALRAGVTRGLRSAAILVEHMAGGR